jgi:Mrp family chromosome partitioning ATPase
MTQLDQAFIKAFSTGTTTHAGTHGEAAVRPPRFARTSPKALGAGVPAPASAIHRRSATHDRSVLSPGSTDRGSMAPLSSFTAQSPGEIVPLASPEARVLTWPAACEHLLAQASRPLNAFAEHLIQAAGQGQKAIGVASCLRGQGRTTVSLALAKHLSGLGLRVLLVDADLEHPTLASSCGLTAYTGWNQVVASELSWNEALIPAADDALTLMPLRTAVPLGPTWTESAHAAAGFSVLRGQFDLILVDTAPLDTEPSIDGVVRLAHFMPIDAIYLVEDARTPSRDMLARTCERLQAAKIRVEGILENFVAASTAEPSNSHDPVAG